MCLKYKVSENTVGQGKIACNKQFLLFSQCFLFGELSPFSNVNLSSANSLILEKPIIHPLGKGQSILQKSLPNNKKFR